MNNMDTSQKPIHILVSDDDESLRSVLKQVLNLDGYDVTLAASGEEALAAFKKKPYPLIFTDIRMGKMSGIELLREIKRHSPDTQVIVMTSYATLDTAITAIQAGAYDYLVKPFDDIALISSVARRAIEKIRLIEENNALMEKLRRQNAELEKTNETLRDLAVRDGLTGLYNHRFFHEAASKEFTRSVRYNRDISLVFADVDYFKHYNDAYGHPEGDKILVALANIFLDGRRVTDTVARYGGEEFVFLFPETNKKDALQVAENIRKKVFEHPFPGRETQPVGRITISMGVAAFPEDGPADSSLIKRADAALYEAKKGGRNKIC
jgi:two-component system, cell cycle response regulator